MYRRLLNTWSRAFAGQHNGQGKQAKKAPHVATPTSGAQGQKGAERFVHA
jgi:hypothetical protein